MRNQILLLFLSCTPIFLASCSNSNNDNFDLSNLKIPPEIKNKTSQTDLNSYWIYTTLHSYFILENEEILDKVNEYFVKLNKEGFYVECHKSYYIKRDKVIQPHE